MEKKPYPSETQERYIVRFPDGMRDQIAEAARTAGRSMNAEIVTRLQASFAPSLPEGLLQLQIEQLKAQLDFYERNEDAKELTPYFLAHELLLALSNAQDEYRESVSFKRAKQLAESCLALALPNIDLAVQDALGPLAGNWKEIQAALKERRKAAYKKLEAIERANSQGDK